MLCLLACGALCHESRTKSKKFRCGLEVGTKLLFSLHTHRPTTKSLVRAPARTLAHVRTALLVLWHCACPDVWHVAIPRGGPRASYPSLAARRFSPSGPHLWSGTPIYPVLLRWSRTCATLGACRGTVVFIFLQLIERLGRHELGRRPRGHTGAGHPNPLHGNLPNEKQPSRSGSHARYGWTRCTFDPSRPATS